MTHSITTTKPRWDRPSASRQVRASRRFDNVMGRRADSWHQGFLACPNRAVVAITGHEEACPNRLGPVRAGAKGVVS